MEKFEGNYPRFYNLFEHKHFLLENSSRNNNIDWDNSAQNIWLDRTLFPLTAQQMRSNLKAKPIKTKIFPQELCKASGQCDKLKLPIVVALQEVQIGLLINENCLVYV